MGPIALAATLALAETVTAAGASPAGPWAAGGGPARFEANVGQLDAHARFLARSAGYRVFLTAAGAVIDPGSAPHRGAAGGARRTRATPGPGWDLVRLRLLGAARGRPLVGEGARPGRVAYIRGREPTRWRAGVPLYERVRHRQPYPGIDVVYHHTAAGRLELDFVVAPGADPRAIRLGIEGARAVALDRHGDLVIGSRGHRLRLGAPAIYQKVHGRRRPVAGRFVLDGHVVTFRLGPYDPTRPLVIDPQLEHASYLGGGRLDASHAVAIGPDGHVFLAGETESVDFPLAADGPTAPRATDVFVARLTPDGRLVSVTYVGGRGVDGGLPRVGLAVDAGGHAYVTGSTDSPDFPVTAGAVQRARRGRVDAFVAKLDPSGTGLVYATYLGGGVVQAGLGITVDRAGHAYVAGRTASPDFPVTRGSVQSALGGETDGFVAKLDTGGAALVYATFLGGPGPDEALAIAVDAAGRAHVTGGASPGFPTTPGAFQRAVAGDVPDAFVVRLEASGATLGYATLLGGAGIDEGRAIAVDAAGSAHVTGQAGSVDFPVTAGAAQSARSGFSDAFVAKLDPRGARLAYATYLGGGGFEAGHGIALDPAGRPWVAGTTDSPDFPATPGAAAGRGGRHDAFVAALRADGGGIAYAIYLGGRGDVEEGHAIAVTADGSVYVTGVTNSPDFPTARPRQPALGGWSDGFLVKLAAADLGPAPRPAHAPRRERRGRRFRVE